MHEYMLVFLRRVNSATCLNISLLRYVVSKVLQWWSYDLDFICCTWFVI